MHTLSLRKHLTWRSPHPSEGTSRPSRWLRPHQRSPPSPPHRRRFFTTIYIASTSSQAPNLHGLSGNLTCILFGIRQVGGRDPISHQWDGFQLPSRRHLRHRHTAVLLESSASSPTRPILHPHYHITSIVRPPHQLTKNWSLASKLQVSRENRTRKQGPFGGKNFYARKPDLRARYFPFEFL